MASPLRLRGQAGVLPAGGRWAAAFVASLLAGGAIADQRPFELGDVGRIVGVSEPQISPDGREVAYVVSRPNLKEARHDTSLEVVDVATGTARQLVGVRKGLASPRWSPTGDRLAFLAQGPAKASADANGHPAPGEPAGAPKEPPEQIFILPMNGGEPVAVTSVPHDVQQFSWSPDGRWLAFAVADDNPAQAEIDRHNDAFEVGNSDYLVSAAPMPVHAWLVSARGDAPRRLTSGAWSLPSSAEFNAPASALSWSPNGKTLAFVQQASPAFGDSDQSVIATVDVATGKIRKLTTHTSFESAPVFSPDGAEIAYWYPRDGDPNNVNEIRVAPFAGGDGVAVTRALDRNISSALWLPGGRSLLVSGHDATRVALWVQPIGGPARRLQLGEVEPEWLYWVDVSRSRAGALAFIGTSVTQPGEIYYLASVDATPRKLTDFNGDIAAKRYGRVESFTWQGPDGFTEDGIVAYPPGFSSERKYPLVLVIHGGPTSASTQYFQPLMHLLAARGYVVFRPNYRGSDNLGNAYQRAIFNDAGDGPGRDVMAGIAALQARGFIDPARIAVSGWSYGGYMATWLIGHYDIWKAAVAGAAVTDLVHEYNLSDGNVTGRYAFGGSPWNANFMKAYMEQSPISYVNRIRTPTLILSDTGDARVPITQSFLLYHGLKDNHVPVRFFAYPIAGHSPGDPVRATDVDRRWIEWIDEQLKETTP